MSVESSYKEIENSLLEKGIIRPIQEHETRLEDKRITSGIGYPITGIEKFLGYYDRSTNIANFPSVSLTTDFSIAFSRCTYYKEIGKDRVILDGKEDPSYNERAGRAIEFFKNLYEVKGSFVFEIRRKRKYRAGKGLGESAAVAAATARSLAVNVFGEDTLKDSAMISRLARLVSGSGTRSVAGGISIWLSYPYIKENNSYGSKLPVDASKIHFGCFPFASSIQTLNAHEKALQSPFYASWASVKGKEIQDIINGGYDTPHLLDLAQIDMYRMHAVMLSQGELLLTSQALGVFEDFKKFQKKNEGIFITADTGPSLVLLSTDRGLIEEFISSQSHKFIWGYSPPEPGNFAEQQTAFDNFEERSGEVAEKQ